MVGMTMFDAMNDHKPSLFLYGNHLENATPIYDIFHIFREINIYSLLINGVLTNTSRVLSRSLQQFDTALHTKPGVLIFFFHLDLGTTSR